MVRKERLTKKNRNYGNGCLTISSKNAKFGNKKIRQEIDIRSNGIHSMERKYVTYISCERITAIEREGGQRNHGYREQKNQ